MQNCDDALKATSKRFDGNVVYNRMDRQGKNFYVTLKVANSRGKGARRGYSRDGKEGRAMIQACWHVYGVFFDELFKANPGIIVFAMGKKITTIYGNWQDTDVGSIAHPIKYSQMCKCSPKDFPYRREREDD